LATIESRKVLPELLAREDAVFNLQRIALLLRSLQSEDYSLLREALCDRLHQPFRQELVPGLERALALQHPDLLGTCLSGAGPSIVALATTNFDEIARLLRESFRETGLSCCVRRLQVHENG
jgi:homoserine kinase